MSAPAPIPLYASEHDDPDVLSPEQERILLRGAAWRRFAVLGDSIAQGLGDPVPGYRPLDWTRRIAAALRHDQPRLAYLNVGERDLTARQVRERQLGAALRFEPDLAMIVAGGNDMLAADFDAERTGEQLDLIALGLRAAGAELLMCTLFDITKAIAMPGRFGARLAARQDALYEVIREVATMRGAVLADCVNHPRSADPSIYSADRIHANLRGHAIAASTAIRGLGERIWAGELAAA